MNRQQLAQVLNGFRKRCDSAGSRQVFDSLMANSPSFVKWARESRGDAVNLPYAARQLEYVYGQAVEVEYPSLVFALESDPLIAWDTEVPEGAQNFVWYLSDGAGDAEFFSAMAHDGLPSPTMMGGEQHGKVEGFGSEIVYTVQQLRAAAFANQTLPADLARVDKQAHAQRLNSTAAWGREDIGLPGFLNHPQIAQSFAANKVGGGTSWLNATPGEMIADVLSLNRGVRADTLRLYSPNVIAMPGEKLDLLAETRLSEDGSTGDMTTVLEYLTKALNRDGRTVRFRECEDLLSENSLGYLDDDGMIAFNDGPRFVSLVVPIWYLIGSVQEQGHNLRTPTESSMGGVKFPYPVTAAMMRGI